jgi:hypothetical protein
MAAGAPSAPARADRPRVPDFFIVGSPKSGTTALYKMLSAHPGIYMPALKEPRFLASDMAPRPDLADGKQDVGYPTTLAAYLALFDDAADEQRAGEASTFYLWSRTAASRIAELQPEARIIAILREPASFLWSLHLMFLQWRVETEKSLQRAMSLEADRREGRSIPAVSHRPQLLQYADHVRYVDQLSRYHERFPSQNVLTLIYDDFRQDNQATIRRILRFLDVDDERPIEPLDVNVTRTTVRSWRTKGLLRSLSTGDDLRSSWGRRVVKSVTTRKLRYAAVHNLQRRVVMAPPPAPAASFMQELRERFKPEVVALSEFLDRDLVALWGYDRVS